jgi:uncharacterized membrane protein YeaQ/YmgE (transglycosylase-associated protein family)
MHLLVWLLVGGLIGWIASMMVRSGHRKQAILDVGVGVAGALLGGWLISPLLGLNAINQPGYSPLSFFVSLAGAVILLAAVRLVRRNQGRGNPLDGK